MFLLTAAEMREVDRLTIDGGHVSGPVLMERAGRGVFELIRERFGARLEGRRLSLLCGKGNNGGDGFVLARHLMEAGAEVTLFLLAPPDQLSPGARLAFEKLLPLAPSLFPLGDEEARAHCAHYLRSSDLAVDALFGTGLSGGLREPGLSAVRLLNRRAPRILALDVPSGISGDPGAETRECVQADLTATIGAPKRGLMEHPGAGAVGELVTVDIGFPHEVLASVAGPDRLVDEEAARALRPAFDPAGHKYRRGTLLLIAGSRRYGGAALLTAGAALRSGAGMVKVAVPGSLAPLVQERHPSAIALALPETPAGFLAPEVFGALDEAAAEADALAIGPGLGRDPELLKALRTWLAGVDRPALLDADALYAWPGALDEPGGHPAPRLLTPHSGELSMLLGRMLPGTGALREVLLALPDSSPLVLAKGAPTFVKGAGPELYTIGGGHPAMARGGTGDILTGLAGGLLASSESAESALLLAAWLHNDAGRRAGRARGRSMHSADILDFLPGAWRDLDRRGPAPAPWA